MDHMQLLSNLYKSSVEDIETSVARNVVDVNHENTEIQKRGHLFPGLMRLTPHMEETIWGGDFFSNLYSMPTKAKIGESWELAIFNTEDTLKQTLSNGIPI